MKKILFYIGALSVIFAFYSCKKDYTCKCTTYIGGTSFGSTTTEIHDTKIKALDKCEDMSYENGSSNSITCKLQ